MATPCRAPMLVLWFETISVPEKEALFDFYE
jgi:hypothetical protein